MTGIYKRQTVKKSQKDEKKKCNRKRDKIINFRVSEEEKNLINERVGLSGLTRQEFFIQSCLEQKIITYGNVKTFAKMDEKLLEIQRNLKSVISGNGLDAEMMEALKTILEMYQGLQKMEENV